MLRSYVEKIYEYPDGSKRITRYSTPRVRGSSSVKSESSRVRTDEEIAEAKEEND